ncbi:hypothetical protein B0O80DRAFT_492396 [Mortierella sp. GBAus27b]|nr:hypothetical protein BGX31_003390 [Mortierella sp. GBA43]KAI8363251.1 hypothetical protein B0O80DRAFT_492396 [Mortierella sp. GBAus27b]
MADYSQTWINQSSTTFVRSAYAVNAAGNPLETEHMRPGEKLKAREGSETLSWSQGLSTLATGPFDSYVIWSTEDHSYSFGINIHIPVQIYMIGTAPYYQVQINNGEWQGEYTADPYVFPTDNFPFVIEVKSVAHHTTLAITVHIADRPKKQH